MLISSPVQNLISNTTDKFDPKYGETYIREHSLDEIIVLGVGSERLVVKDPITNLAVKISYSEDNLQNKTEYYIYNNCSRSIQRQLLPIIEADTEGFTYLIYPSVKQQYEGPRGRHEAFYGPEAERLAQKIKNDGFDIYELETAVFRDQVVAIDYGFLQSPDPTCLKR